MYELNVRSAYVATREAGIHFREQGSGAILNIFSDAGIHGVKGGAHYASAKAALQMFTTVTAAEWADTEFGSTASQSARSHPSGWCKPAVDGGPSLGGIPDS